MFGVFSDHEIEENVAAEEILKEASDLLNREEAPDSDPERELYDDPPLPSDISVVDEDTIEEHSRHSHHVSVFLMSFEA